MTTCTTLENSMNRKPGVYSINTVTSVSCKISLGVLLWKAARLLQNGSCSSSVYRIDHRTRAEINGPRIKKIQLWQFWLTWVQKMKHVWKFAIFGALKKTLLMATVKTVSLARV